MEGSNYSFILIVFLFLNTHTHTEEQQQQCSHPSLCAEHFKFQKQGQLKRRSSKPAPLSTNTLSFDWGQWCFSNFEQRESHTPSVISMSGYSSASFFSVPLLGAEKRRQMWREREQGRVYFNWLSLSPLCPSDRLTHTHTHTQRSYIEPCRRKPSNLAVLMNTCSPFIKER